ncbi:helix-turn-helix domain-containing protein [Rhodococcus sp. NM-2]|uniref:helix-turn-helix domain-containing protein n=1 Tax=Rhodococcus TaxID=1827 RepID=UPI0007CD5941|nr:helix-turn-helix domain-containing protein [Rhodococcus opacus]MDX5962267.1 helix-turn-helix domain-containing protein [Rhodococcus opacus]CAG7641872.1 hypothetical protein E143388_08329 [Rhodococcus opacus]
MSQSLIALADLAEADSRNTVGLGAWVSVIRRVDTSDAARALELRVQGLSAAEVGRSLGVSRATVYRYLADDTQVTV